MTCCGFGHRDVFQNIDKELCEAVQSAVRIGCDVFYTGLWGILTDVFRQRYENKRKKQSLYVLSLICQTNLIQTSNTIIICMTI